MPVLWREEELEKVTRILKKLGLAGREEVVLIDACATNKPSTSKADNH